MTHEDHLRHAITYLKALEERRDKAMKASKQALVDLLLQQEDLEIASTAFYEANMSFSAAFEDFRSSTKALEIQEEKHALALEELLRLKDLS
jgi:bacterioferritin (cytochrome b1)